MELIKTDQLGQKWKLLKTDQLGKKRKLMKTDQLGKKWKLMKTDQIRYEMETNENELPPTNFLINCCNE
jgi:hypothetical protein